MNKLASTNTKEAMDEMANKATGFYNFLVNTGHLGLLRKSYQQYYSGVFRGGIIRKAGERGEIADFTTADYRNLLLHILGMSTNGKIKWDAKATNSDYSSQAQTLLAPGLLDYYNQFKGANAAAKKAMEFNIWAGTGYVLTKWDETVGDDMVMHPDDMQAGMEGTLEQDPRMIRSGDVTFKSLNMIDVVIDPTVRHVDDLKWFIVREYENIDELTALYPEHEQHIKTAVAVYDPRREIEDIYSIRAKMIMSPTTAVTWTLYHEKTPSCPEGRILKMVGNGNACLSDEPLYTPRIPLARFQTSTIERTPLGYAEAWDILPLQQVRDIAIRTITTNVANTGIVNILNPSGSNISVKQMRGGMNILEYQQPFKPEVLALEATSPNVFNLDKLATSTMQTTLGVNDVQRGNPEAGVKAGVALALLQSLSVQFQTRHSQTWAFANEHIGMDLLNTLRVKVTTARKIAIVGKLQGQYMSEFIGNQLEGIERVVVDLGNPLMATISGRVNVASEMLQNGLIKDSDQYLQILSVGILDPAVQPIQAENMRIKSENEAMLEGAVPPVLYTDKHPKDIQEHLALLSTPEARTNPQVVAAVTHHVQTHMDLWNQMSQAQPSMLAALGIPPIPQGPPLAGPIPDDDMSGPPLLPPPPMLPPPMPEGGAGGGEGKKEPINPSQGPALLPPSSPPPQNEFPKPKNPMTGNTWNPETGGA